MRRFLWEQTTYVHVKENLKCPYKAWSGAIINPHWLKLPLSRTNFPGPKGVRAIEVLLYPQSGVCHWHRCSRQGWARTRSPGWNRDKRHKIEISPENQTDNKQRQWHPEGDQSKKAKAGSCNKLQVPQSSFSDVGSKPEILSRISQATAAALTKLKPFWRELTYLLDQRWSWYAPGHFHFSLYLRTLTVEWEKRMQAIKMRCHWMRLNILTMLPLRKFRERSEYWWTPGPRTAIIP